MSEEIKHAPKLFKADCEINWEQSAKIIYNRIRGLSPYPTAFTTLLGKNLKIFSALVEDQQPNCKPGDFVSDHKSYLKFAAADGWLNLQEVQLEGKKKMGIEEFLRGVRL